MVYGTYNELVFMGFINHLTSLGGPTLYKWMSQSKGGIILGGSSHLGSFTPITIWLFNIAMV